MKGLSSFCFCAALLTSFFVSSEVVHASPVKIKIIDGTSAPVGQFPYVASMALGDFTCTGTLVGSKYVLTAAHCFYDENNKRVTNLSGYGAILNGTFYAAANVTVHPTYVPRSSACIDGERDAAIMELSSEPQGITPVPLQRSTPAVGASILLVGFGIQGNGNSGENGTFPSDNIVNYGSTTIESVDDSYVNWIFNSGAGESNTAGGDSGGPAFIDVDGTRYINSITCGGTGNAGFNTSSSNTRADVIADWVDSIAGTTPANQAPAFVALPAQTIGVGQTFSYAVQVTGTAPIAVTTTSELPPGLSFDGYTITGTPTTVGFYNVTLSATNSSGSSSGSLDINVMKANPETALSITRVTLSFAEDADNLLSIKGKLKLWNKFAPKKSTVSVKIAELAESFTLNNKGVGRHPGGFDQVRLVGKLSRGKFVRPNVQFSIGLGDDDTLYEQLDQLFPLESEDGDTAPLPIEITVNGVSYTKTVTMQYDEVNDIWENTDD